MCGFMRRTWSSEAGPLRVLSVMDQTKKKHTLTGVLYRDGVTVRPRSQVSVATWKVAFEVTVPWRVKPCIPCQPVSFKIPWCLSAAGFLFSRVA